MADEDKERAGYRALVDRVLTGDGRASAEQRARAFGNDGLAPPLDAVPYKLPSRPCNNVARGLAPSFPPVNE